MSKAHRIIIILGVSGAAAAIFVMTLVHAVWYAPDGSADESGPAVAAAAYATTTESNLTASQIGTSTGAVSKHVPVDYPKRLLIPSLGIDANVQYVGITYKGNVGTPSNFTDVAWYKLGTIPGHMGSAIIDGHVDNGLALPGVFKHLGDIATGTDVYITRVDGSQLHFIVSAINSYDYQGVPTDQIFNQNDQAYVKLITCTGDWVQGDRTYNERLVVTATLASS